MQAVLFDMDGVLVDSEHIYNAIEVEMCQAHGIRVTDDIRLAFVGATMQDAWAKVVKIYQLDISIEDMVDEEKRRYVKALNKGRIESIKGMVALLKKLHKQGYKTAIVSSSQRDILDISIEKYGFNQYIDCSISSQDVKNGKPAPDPFLLAANKMGVKPEQCVVIEDSNNGAIAAKAAGMICVGYQPENELPQDLSAADIRVREASALDTCKLEGLFELAEL